MDHGRPREKPTRRRSEIDRAALPLAVFSAYEGTPLARRNSREPPSSTRSGRSPAMPGRSTPHRDAARRGARGPSSPSTLTGHGREWCPTLRRVADLPRSGSAPTPIGVGKRVEENRASNFIQKSVSLEADGSRWVWRTRNERPQDCSKMRSKRRAREANPGRTNPSHHRDGDQRYAPSRLVRRQAINL